ncbi:MAG: hypothetical protein QGF46_01410, partial [Planctomycetota bacterium]|nr:hypothetical protein [Planctomycetota bacterium]
MRTSLPTLLLSLVAVSIPACQSCPQAAQAWVSRPDYSSAQGCASSFLAALSLDNIQAEYRCFGAGLKSKYGATLDAYIIGRPQLTKDLGSLQQLAFNLQFISDSKNADGSVLTWWGLNQQPKIGIVCAPQSFFSIDTNSTEYGALLQHPHQNYLDIEGKSINASITDSIIRSLPPL